MAQNQSVQVFGRKVSTIFDGPNRRTGFFITCKLLHGMFLGCDILGGDVLVGLNSQLATCIYEML